MNYADIIAGWMTADSYSAHEYAIEDLHQLYWVHPKEVERNLTDVFSGENFVRDTEESGTEWNRRFAWAMDVIAHAIASYYSTPPEEEPEEDWSDWSDDDERYIFGQGSDLEP
jgi:hypothetical protein